MPEIQRERLAIANGAKPMKVLNRDFPDHSNPSFFNRYRIERNVRFSR